MNYILFDDHWEDLLPLTFTRPVCKLRVGIDTIEDKWQVYTGMQISYLTRDYLRIKYPPHIDPDMNMLLNASVIPNDSLWKEIKALKKGQVLLKDKTIIAVILDKSQIEAFSFDLLKQFEIVALRSEMEQLIYPWDIFMLNGKCLRQDIQRYSEKMVSFELSSSNRVIGNHEVLIGKDVCAEDVTINASNGPVYIGNNAEIMEGSLIRGPFAMCDNAVVKMGTKIYGPTTLGPHVKVGGELNNVVVQGYSNKSHDGFIGNSVIGEWCNLGADTNTSNLKNNYGEIKLWNYRKNDFIQTGLHFCGLIMGDHSKSSINTMFNTGSVVGVNVNVFGAGFPVKFLPSFTWGGVQGVQEYKLDKAAVVAQRMMERRHLAFDQKEQAIMAEIFKLTAKYRKF
ncbi:MAG: putative sugar nucleotidyl transferase [Bacteroidota bacterium]